MSSEITLKLIKRVNFEYAKKFDLARTKELSFVPVSVKSNTFFAAVPQAVNKAAIKEYIKSILNLETEFIFLTTESFAELFELYEKEFNKVTGAKVLTDPPAEISAETPIEVPIETPAETPAEISAEVPVEAPDEVPAEAPVQDVTPKAKAKESTEPEQEDDLDISLENVEIESLNIDDVGEINLSEEEETPAQEDNDYRSMGAIAAEKAAKENRAPKAAKEEQPGEVQTPEEQAPQTDKQPEPEQKQEKEQVQKTAGEPEKPVNDTLKSEPLSQEPPQQPQPPKQTKIDNPFVAQPVNIAQPQPVQNKPEFQGNKPMSKISQVKDAPKKKIGEILIEEGLITQKQLEIALAESKATKVPLGSTLVRLNFINVQDLKEALGAQQGLELVRGEQLKPIAATVKILPEEFVTSNKVIPLSANDKSLVVGMVNPGDVGTINEIVYLTGLRPTVMMITHYEFSNFVEQFYHSQAKEAEKLMRDINQDSLIEEVNKDTLYEQVSKEVADTTGLVAKLANRIITMAIDQRASDIHIEPRFKGYVVRYRSDGILKQVLEIPDSVDSAVISRIKVLAKMNIAEHRRPQDGNFAIRYKQGTYDFRVNTLPVSGKEKMVIRILAPAASLKAEKDEIKIDGMLPEQLQKIKDMASMPNGIILTSGPTGSGKTTTLYSLIKALNDIKVNITTIEDPIEIRMEGINQSATNVKAGITFASCMRAILRQDPDIILVGEIRDYETLEVAVSAALTGHLVLSTVHTNSAAATVTRLVEMGAKDYLVASTLTGVLAQRLVRRLCNDCKESYNPSPEEAKKVLLDPKAQEEFTKVTAYRAVGCEKCENKGYKGRLGVYEVMQITKELRKMIVQKLSEIELEEYSVEHGMITLQGSCLEHIKAGLTTVEEFVRVLGLATD